MNRQWLELFARGVPIFETDAIEFMRETHRQERKWAHRKMWKVGQRFTIKQQCVVMVFNGAMCANPKTVRLIEVACK